MRAKFKNRKSVKNRRAVAAVEAAVCFPILILIWLGSFELARVLSLKQQAQLFASTAAQQVLESNTSFATIETDVEALALSLGIQECEATLVRTDSEIVESTVTIDYGSNSPLSSIFQRLPVQSTYFSFRPE